MFTLVHGEDSGFTLFSCLLVILVSSLFSLSAGRIYLHLSHFWHDEQVYWQGVKRRHRLSLLVPLWWQHQRVLCDSSCGCDRQVAVFSGAHHDHFPKSWRPEYGEVLRVLRCWHQAEVGVSLFVAPYRGLSGNLLGLYYQIGAQPRKLLVLGVDVMWVQTVPSLLQFQGLHSSDHQYQVLVLKFKMPGYQDWRVVL